MITKHDGGNGKCAASMCLQRAEAAERVWRLSSISSAAGTLLLAKNVVHQLPLPTGGGLRNRREED